MRCGTLLLLLVSFCLAGQYSAHTDTRQHPVIHLRSAQINTATATPWHVVHRARKLVDASGQHQPHVHADWGVLHSMSQMLVTMIPQRTHEQQLALEQDIERAGGYVSTYLPDDTWLVIGDARVAEAANAAELVHWVGAYTPSMKIDPECKTLLNVRHDVLQQHLDGTATESMSDVQTARVIQGMDTQPCMGMPNRTCLSLAVVFPPTVEVINTADQSSTSSSRFVHRARPSTAAVADWRDALESTFNEAVSIAPHGHHQVTITTPVDQFAPVLSWLSDQASVHWISPRWKLTQHNFEASAVIQSGQSAGNKGLDDAGIRPIWAGGITGRNQVLGMGDSGIDFNHCFFVDPTINLNADSSWTIDSNYGFPIFNSTRHRKIRLYYAFTGDRRDSNGHGTHTSGSAVGAPVNGNQYEGMAPDAKIAFWDLGRGGVDTIVPPADLNSDYYPVSYSVGARVHSDSWGSSSIAYDELAAQVDMFSWAHPDFLPMFAAGNDGNTRSVGGRISGERTVTSPGTAKNTITVGATDSLYSSAAPDMTKYAVYDMTSTKASGGRPYTVRVVQATFGGSVSSLVGSSKNYRLVVADPLQACTPITNGASLQGAVALVQRGGNCNFDVKVMYVQQAGAAAALVFDNAPGAYFKLGSDGTTNPTVPAMAIPRRIGQTFYDLLEAGEQVTVTFSNAKMPANTFDNLAAYSSQGPTPDGRIKPDIVAPGTTQSSHIGPNSCGTQIMQGTSMATPIVAGAALLVRQYFVDGYYPTGKADGGNVIANPSAALVKAMLLGGATALTGFEADTGLPIDPAPSTRQGFGRVLLRDTLPLNVASSSLRVQIVDSAPIKQGETHRYCVSARGGRFTVVLVWTDYPASSSAGSNLVNDLDLVVRAAGLNGSVLLGNGGGFGDGADRVNNVEQVDMPDMPSGDVSIEVTGYRLPMGKASPQPYALVVLGSFEGVLVSDFNPAAKGVSARECSVGAVTITSGPQGLTNSRPVQFSFKTAQGGTGSLECQLSTANGSTNAPGTKGWSDCSGGSVEYKDVGDGNYLFQVRIKGSSSSSARTFVLDTTPPRVTLNTQPQPSSAQSVALTDWAAADLSGVSSSCRLDVGGGVSDQGSVFDSRGNTVPLGQWQRNCTSPQSFHWLLPGNWTLSINATDDAGNTAPIPYSTSWQVAFEPGNSYVRFTRGTYGVSNRNSTQFSFRTWTADTSGRVSSRASATECAFTSVNSSMTVNTVDSIDPTTVDGVTWEVCSGNYSKSNMEDGSYLMMARVQQQPSGRRLLATPADTYALSMFTIDTTPPAVNITSAPPLYTSRSNAEFVFAADDANATFACALLPGTTATPPGNGTAGSGNFTVCTSPATYPALADGWYTWWLGATDLAGNTAQPSNSTFLVDTKPPAVTLQCPGATQASSFVVSWNANDGNGSGIASTQCKFFPVMLKNGTTGSADNTTWTTCTSPLNYTNMPEGRYGFQLQVTDRANVSTTPVPCAIAVDTTAPNTTIASGPDKNDLQPPQVTFTLVADDGAYGSNVSLYQCQLNKISDADYQQLRGGSVTVDIQLASTTWFNCSSTTVVDQTQLSTGNWAFRARVVDNAGNVGVPTAVYVFRVDSSIPIPSSVQASSSSSSMSLPLIIGIAVGAAALGFLLIILIYSCCARRRRAAMPPGAVTYPPGAAVVYPPQAPPQSDPALEAAIAASLMDAPPGTMPPPSGGVVNGVPPGGGVVNPMHAPAAYAASPYPPTVNPMMMDPAAAAYVVPSPPPMVGVPRDVEEAALEAAIQASLQEQGPPNGVGAGVAGEDDEVYRQAMQASLQERYMQARQRQQEEVLTASAHSPEQEDDPELRAAIAASLADQGSGGSVVAPAHGPSAPYYVYPPPPPGGEP